MSALGRRYLSSAVCGFAITAAFVRYQMLTDIESPLSRNPLLMIFFIVVCPPSLLSLLFDPEAGTNGFYILWAFIGLLNAGVYASFRAIITRRLKKAD
jgi:hypothetical protein